MGPLVRLVGHIEIEDGAVVFRHACKLGLEGIVSKLKDSPYRSDRSPDWVKCTDEPSCAPRGGRRMAPPEQYEVVFEGRHVERIYLANPHDKAGLNWYWGVNWFERPRETAHTSWDGYADSRDAAIVDAGAILPRSAV